MKMLTVIPIPAFKDNYIWLVLDNQHRAILVDPGDATPVLQVLQDKKIDLQAIWITHHHYDHCSGVREILEHFPVPVYGPCFDGTIAGLSNPMQQGDKIAALGESFEILDIPGHTKGHIAFVGAGRVFCGDTLFTAGCGRLFEGTAAQLYDSLQKLAALPEDTLIYCGHEYTLNNLRFAQIVEPDNTAIQRRLEQVIKLREQNLPTVPSNLAIEKQTNPFLRCNISNVQKAVQAYLKTKSEHSIEYFAILRLWKDNFT
jgi:hydroxyacylglutathione hydrolase